MCFGFSVLNRVLFLFYRELWQGYSLDERLLFVIMIKGRIGIEEGDHPF